MLERHTHNPRGLFSGRHNMKQAAAAMTAALAVRCCLLVSSTCAAPAVAWTTPPQDIARFFGVSPSLQCGQSRRCGISSSSISSSNSRGSSWGRWAEGSSGRPGSAGSWLSSSERPSRWQKQAPWLGRSSSCLSMMTSAGSAVESETNEGKAVVCIVCKTYMYTSFVMYLDYCSTESSI